MNFKRFFLRINALQHKYLSEKSFVFILSIIIGFFAAVAAVILKNSVHSLENWVRNITSTSLPNWFFLIFPLIGILITVTYIRLFVKEDIGHGVSRILYAISRNKAVLKLHNVYSSIIACSFTGGLGGSVGMEAPIVNTGAAIGSNVAQAFQLGYKRTSLLVACGAAAAVAAIFKAPIAGVIFALEVLMLDLTMSSLIPLLISAVTATIFSTFFLGKHVEFYFTLRDPFDYGNIPFYILLGLVTGLVSLYFMVLNRKVESRIKKVAHPYTRVLIGGSLLGLLIFFFPPLFGEGYIAMKSLLSGNPGQMLDSSIFFNMFDDQSWWFILFLFGVLVFKVIATSITTGSGGIGGAFAPSLFMGGITGYIFARSINMLGWFSISEKNFALVGMAGLMAGVIHSPLTAIFLIAEITGGYELFIPLIITSSISFITIKYFEPHSIYTKNLAEHGDLITHHKDKAVLTMLSVKEVLETNFISLNANQNLGDIVKAIADSKRNIFPVLDDDGIFLGLVPLDDVREIMFDRSKYSEIKVVQLMVQPSVSVEASDTMDIVMRKFKQSGYWNLPVLEEGKYLGFVSRANVFNYYRKQLIEFSEE